MCIVPMRSARRGPRGGGNISPVEFLAATVIMLPLWFVLCLIYEWCGYDKFDAVPMAFITMPFVLVGLLVVGAALFGWRANRADPEYRSRSKRRTIK